MKFYLASQFARQNELQGYAGDLMAKGHNITSRWIWEKQSEEEEYGFPGYAENDKRDIISCDIFILFSGPPYYGSIDQIARGGRHYEMGFAEAHKKELVIIGPRESIYHYSPQVKQFDTWKEFLNAACQA